MEQSGNNVLVLHRNNQVALLPSSPDIDRKAQEMVERRRKELKECMSSAKVGQLGLEN